LDRLRRVVPNGQTVSIGIARWDGEEEPFPLLQRADQALYLAKSGGRDRSVLAVDRPVLPLEPSLRQVST
jgi:PleD family two-component response regulator